MDYWAMRANLANAVDPSYKLPFEEKIKCDRNGVDWRCLATAESSCGLLVGLSDYGIKSR